MSRRNTGCEITPDLMLRAYATGIFPMAESKSSESVLWVSPRERGILPLETFHVPRSLRKIVRQKRFEVRSNTAFKETVKKCSQPGRKRFDTWINGSIEKCVNELHARGFAHSVECWRDNKLVGGLYGIALGAAFFGESMFSHNSDASKVALVYLVTYLKLGGYMLLDTQFVTDHLEKFGVIEIPSEDYMRLLEQSLKYQAIFPTRFTEIEWESTLNNILYN